jgi:hypothetical protein
MNKLKILAIVCSVLHLDYERVISSGKRDAELVWARYLCCYFARQYELGSYKAIGEYYGNLEHATAMYAIRVVMNEIETNKFRRMQFEEIRIMLESKFPKDKNAKPVKENNDFNSQCVEVSPERLFHQAPKYAIV